MVLPIKGFPVAPQLGAQPAMTAGSLPIRGGQPAAGRFANLGARQGGAQQINTLFNQILGRDVDPEGLQFFLGDLAQGQSISDVARSIQSSDGAARFATGAPEPTRTGLAGAEQALAGASTGAQQALMGAQQQGLESLDVGAAGFQPFMQAGQGASDIQSALALSLIHI